MLLRRSFFLFFIGRLVLPGVVCEFCFRSASFFLETFYQVIRRLILDGDIKGGRKGEEST